MLCGILRYAFLCVVYLLSAALMFVSLRWYVPFCRVLLHVVPRCNATVCCVVVCRDTMLRVMFRDDVLRCVLQLSVVSCSVTSFLVCVVVSYDMLW